MRCPELCLLPQAPNAQWHIVVVEILLKETIRVVFRHDSSVLLVDGKPFIKSNVQISTCISKICVER